MIITEPGLYDGIPNAEYHAHPALSSSGAKKLLPPYCPALFQHERTNPVYKSVFDFGSAAHKKVLGDLGVELVIVEAEDWRKTADQKTRREAREAGKVPVLRGEYEQIEEMAAAIKAHPLASRLFAPGTGKSEQSAFWQDNPSGIWRRARFDWLPNLRPDGRLIIPDYKTCVSADPETFAKSVADFGYHQQADWYLTAARALNLDPDPAFVFVAQEKKAPYLVSVIELDDTALTIGRNLNRGAINIYAECMKTGIWPGYTSGVELVSLPAWYARRFDEDAA